MLSQLTHYIHCINILNISFNNTLIESKRLALLMALLNDSPSMQHHILGASTSQGKLYGGKLIARVFAETSIDFGNHHRVRSILSGK